MPRRDPAELVPRLRTGQRVALARALTVVERAGPEARELHRLLALDPAPPARVTGITGPPGAGKSALVDAMVREARSRGRRMAVLAVDPSSSRTGGALLGDRVRMGSRTGDDGVVIRSLASRGATGGLATAVPAAVRVMEAAGFGEVLIETVGVGQVELDIATAADVTVLVTPPGLGDAVQAAKAGLIEVADICVVTKADRPGAQTTARELRSALDLADHSGSVTGDAVPVVLTAAGPASPEGIAGLWEEIDRFSDRADAAGETDRRRQRRVEAEVVALATETTRRRLDDAVRGEAARGLLDGVASMATDPWDAAARLLEVVSLPNRTPAEGQFQMSSPEPPWSA